jgi:hypothetical protein
MKGYFSLLEALPTILPNLVFLHLSVGGRRLSINPPSDKVTDEVFRDVTETLLQPIDRAVRKLPRLSHCYISVPFFSWVGLLGVDDGMRLCDEGLNDPRLNAPRWRHLHPQPEPQRAAGAEEAALKGYWIIQGDHPPQLTVYGI